MIFQVLDDEYEDGMVVVWEAVPGSLVETLTDVSDMFTAYSIRPMTCRSIPEDSQLHH